MATQPSTRNSAGQTRDTGVVDAVQGDDDRHPDLLTSWLVLVVLALLVIVGLALLAVRSAG